MFQGSFFIHSQLRCLEHPRQVITHICMDNNCNQNPFACQQCIKTPTIKQRHYGHDLQLRPFTSTIEQIAKIIKSSKKQIQNMYKSLISQNLSPSSKGNLNTTVTQSNTPNLIKYQQQKQQHYQSVRKHIQSIKYELSEEVRQLIHKFQQALQNQLQNMHKQLQKYYSSYKQYFQAFSHKMAPVVLINKQFKYYNRPETISIKLMNQINPQQRSKWFIDLKKSTHTAQKVLMDYEGQIDKLKRISNKTNQMMDMLPRVRGPDYQNQIRRAMSSSAKQIIRCVVKFGQDDFIKNNKTISMGDVYGHHKNLSSIHRSQSMQQVDHSYNGGYSKGI